MLLDFLVFKPYILISKSGKWSFSSLFLQTHLSPLSLHKVSFRLPLLLFWGTLLLLFCYLLFTVTLGIFFPILISHFMEKVLYVVSWERVQGGTFLKLWIFYSTFSSVQPLSRVWLFVNPWTAAHQASLFITNFHNLLKLMSIESVMPSNHLILCCPLILPPSIIPSIRVFSSESVLHLRWAKYWSFSFSISPFNEYSGLISLKMDWLDLLAAQGTLKSLLQHHSSKASILQCSAFFLVQLSHPYMTTGKTKALTRWIFVGK